MSKSATDGPGGERGGTSSLIKHRPFIFVLIPVLVCLIILVNALRTEASPPVVTTIAPEAEAAVDVRQLDGVLLAGASAAGESVWRAVGVSRPVCGPAAFENGSPVIDGNLVVLEEADVGGRYCFEALAGGRAAYRLSEVVTAFRPVAAASGDGLEIVDVRSYGDVSVAWSSRPAYWQSVALTIGEGCSAENFAGAANAEERFSLATYHLPTASGGPSRCFQAYDHSERAFRAIRPPREESL